MTKRAITEDIKPIAKVYDEIAESFDKTRKHPWKEVTEFIGTLPKGAIALDLGCGNGRHTKLLLENDLETIATDISFNILKIARENELSNYYKLMYGLLQSDVHNLPFNEQSIDYFIMIAVIHHFDTSESRLKVLKEVARIIKRNGIGILSCWLKTHPRFSKDDLKDSIEAGKKDILVPWTLEGNKKIMRYYYLFEPGEIKELVESIGFEIISSQISNHNLFLTIKKR
ncbi:MAG: class I SAM-dependent methyltransferase [Asgard group archaeon]|nr:class I SAM-dependent methyltransferase [Asgard group archaeon]